MKLIYIGADMDMTPLEIVCYSYVYTAFMKMKPDENDVRAIDKLREVTEYVFTDHQPKNNYWGRDMTIDEFIAVLKYKLWLYGFGDLEHFPERHLLKSSFEGRVFMYYYSIDWSDPSPELKEHYTTADLLYESGFDPDDDNVNPAGTFLKEMPSVKCAIIQWDHGLEVLERDFPEVEFILSKYTAGASAHFLAAKILDS